MDLGDHIRAVLALDRTASALEQGASWATAGDVDALIGRLDRALDRHGLGSDAPVAIVARLRAPMVAALVGVVVARRCVVIVSPLLADERLAEEIRTLGCAAVIASVDDWDRPGVEAAAVDALRVIVGATVGAVQISDALRVAAWTPRPGVAVQMLTSGTTGPPKRIDLTRDALAATLLSASAHYEGRSGAPVPKLRTGVVLTWNPLAHVSGLFDVLSAFADGRRLVVQERFEPTGWAAAVERHGVKVTGMTPTALRMVLDAGIPRDTLVSLKALVCGSARLEPDLGERFEAAYGIPILEVYGATEFGGGGVAGWTMADHRAFMPAKRGSTGRAQPGVELGIVDPHSGEALPSGAQGLVRAKGGALGPEWLTTNDVGRIDDDGFLWIVGRADDVIVRGGFKIQPSKVVAALELHRAVAAAAVVGRVDARLGQVPVAAVELCVDARPPTEDELDAHARAHLAPYEVPVAYRVVDALPRTASTKVSKPGVLALFAEPD